MPRPVDSSSGVSTGGVDIDVRGAGQDKSSKTTGKAFQREATAVAPTHGLAFGGRIQQAAQNRTLALRTVRFDKATESTVGLPRGHDERSYLDQEQRDPRPMSVIVPGLSQAPATQGAQSILVIDTQDLEPLYAYKKDAMTKARMDPFDEERRDAKCLPPNPVDMQHKMDEIRDRTRSAYQERTSGHYEEDGSWTKGRETHHWFHNHTQVYTEVIYNNYSRSDILGTALTNTTGWQTSGHDLGLVEALKSHAMLRDYLQQPDLPVMFYNSLNGTVEETFTLDELGGDGAVETIAEVTANLATLCSRAGINPNNLTKALWIIGAKEGLQRLMAVQDEAAKLVAKTELQDGKEQNKGEAKAKAQRAMMPILEQLFAQKTLVLDRNSDLDAQADQVARHYYQRAYLDSSTTNPEALLVSLRGDNTTNHAVHTMVVGQALCELMQQHFDSYQQLFMDSPELEQLLPLACLYQDSGARAGDERAQAAQAAKHFTDDMLASGYSPKIVEQLANVLREGMSGEWAEDSSEGLVAQLIQLSSQVTTPAEQAVAAGLPCAENEAFIDDLAAFTKSARILSAMAGEYHPTSAHEDAKAYANTHGLIDLGALGRARRYAMKVSATPVQDIKLWLDNHVQREVALRAGISIDSDHELHQIPMPKDLPLVDKFLLDRSYMEPLLAQLSEQAKSHPPQHGTGSLTQELLKSEAVQNAIKNDHGIDVERVREVDVYKSRKKPPKQHTLLSTRYPQNKK